MDGRCSPDTLQQIRMEYVEMPDLKLTLPQARRLFALPLDECQAALESLVSAGFLALSRDGAFLRRSDSSLTAA